MINWYQIPGVVETFDVNTSIAGTPSAASAAFFGTSQDEDFVITNDNYGNSILVVGDATDDNYFATGTSDSDAFAGSPYLDISTATFYTGTSPYMVAYAGEETTGAQGSVISISAVPEPTGWTLMFVGMAAVGTAFRSRRKLAAIAV